MAGAPICRCRDPCRTADEGLVQGAGSRQAAASDSQERAKKMHCLPSLHRKGTVPRLSEAGSVKAAAVLWKHSTTNYPGPSCCVWRPRAEKLQSASVNGLCQGFVMLAQSDWLSAFTCGFGELRQTAEGAMRQTSKGHKQAVAPEDRSALKPLPLRKVAAPRFDEAGAVPVAPSSLPGIKCFM